LKQIEKKGKRTQMTITAVLPLLKLDLHLAQGIQKKQLPNGYELVRRDEIDDRLERFNDDHFKAEFGETLLNSVRYADLYLRISSRVETSEFDRTVDYLNERIDRFLLALNVNERLWTFQPDVRLSWIQNGSRAQLTNREYWPRSVSVTAPTLKDFSAAAKLAATIDHVYSGKEAFAAVRVAFDALRLGSYSFNTSTRFLQEAIALEALCSASSAEVTHRISTTCAILIGGDIQQRKSTYKEAQRLYSIRSSIVHGSESRVAIREVKNIERFVRSILRQVLSENLLARFETVSKQREFLLELNLAGTPD
jgi:hypothetical protein